jgi:hypothetical protein
LCLHKYVTGEILPIELNLEASSFRNNYCY